MASHYTSADMVSEFLSGCGVTWAFGVTATHIGYRSA
jgi:hypothetical protein